MHVFIVDNGESRVLSKVLNQTGTLRLETRIEIRGNHRKGNVPVNIFYTTQFVPDEKFWEIDAKYPGEEPLPLTYIHRFDTENERLEHCGTWYEIVDIEELPVAG